MPENVSMGNLLNGIEVAACTEKATFEGIV